MDKKELSELYLKYRIYIFPAVVGFASLLLILLVIYPQTTTLIDNQKKAEELSVKAETLEKKAQVLEGFDPDDLERKVDSVLGSYPTEKDAIYSLSLLQAITTQAGFNIISITLGSLSVESNPGTQSYNLKLEVTGPGQLLPTLISNIENSPRLMKVDSFDVSSSSSGATTAALLIDVLYSPAPKEFGTIESPVAVLSSEDEQVIDKLSSTNISRVQETLVEGPRGRTNPFE